MVTVVPGRLEGGGKRGGIRRSACREVRHRQIDHVGARRDIREGIDSTQTGGGRAERSLRARSLRGLVKLDDDVRDTGFTAVELVVEAQLAAVEVAVFEAEIDVRRDGGANSGGDLLALLRFLRELGGCGAVW